MSTELLQAGIAAFKGGDKAKARHLFMQAVKADRGNEKAWLLLSRAAKDEMEQEKCLRQVLKLNPGSERARQALGKLQDLQAERMAAEMVASEPVMPSKPEITVAATVPAKEDLPEWQYQLSGSGEAAQAVPQKKREKTWVDQALPAIMIGSGVLLILMICIGLASAIRPDAPEEVAASEDAPGFFEALRSAGGGSSTPVADVPNKLKREVHDAIQSNVSATNAENEEWYMNTIHPDSPTYNKTSREISSIFKNYDLEVSVSGMELIYYSDKEARVKFTLTTLAPGSSFFRDNRLQGVFIMRKDNGSWKIYNQKVENVEYLD